MIVNHMNKICDKCNCVFDAKRREKRCVSCRYVSVICKNCGIAFKTLFRNQRTKSLCGLVCLGVWSAKNRINPPRSEQAKKNMSEAQKKAYKDGRKVSWNKLPENELLARKKMRNAMGSALHRTLKRIGTIKEGTKTKILGYTTLQLKEHIESLWEVGMTWKNYGNRKGQWDIDHIKPISSFSLDVPPSIVNALSNLRPMWADENLHKSGSVEVLQ